MFRTTLMTPQARRRSGVVVAAATAALILAPGAAFAAGQPAGPGDPGTSHSAGAGHAGGHKGGRSGHSTGHTAGHSNRSGGHAGTGHSGSGHSGSGHAGTGHSGSGHSASHTTGHAGRGHTAGHPTGHATGHTTGHPASHRTASHKTSPASETTTSGASRTPSDSGGSGGSASDTSQNRDQQGMVDTVTKVSVSSTRADDGSLTMAARVSPANRTPGASAATGTVEFFLDGASSGPIPLSNGHASVQIDLGPGDHTASAKYSGDAEHAPSDSGPVSVSRD